MPLTAVFDTNILLSSALFGGIPEACVALARQGTVTGLCCREILLEVADILVRKFDCSDQEADALVADYLTFLHLIDLPHIVAGVCVDPDDDHVIECGVIGGATHIVTGDRRHLLPLREYDGVAIVTASEFLAIVGVQA